MTKWEKFYNNQNATTRAWLDAQAKEDNKFVVAIGLPIFFLGVVVGILIGIGI